MRLIIVSGLSGSGKSVALHLLEDIDFYCVDNIPAALLKPFISHTIRGTDDVYPRTAVGLDARNRPNEIETIPALVAELRRSGINCEVLYLHASDEVLLKRYAETRRKHPLIAAGLSLREAIDSERRLLEPITSTADLVIDTSHMGVHSLRERLRERIDRRQEGRLALLFESFGYKPNPGDADLFSTCAPAEPFWEHSLRHLMGAGRGMAPLMARSPASAADGGSSHPVRYAGRPRPQLLPSPSAAPAARFRVFAQRLAEHFRQSYPRC
jgi:UPF0042 nucleotide-binding protein